jgi:hypothetical protein
MTEYKQLPATHIGDIDKWFKLSKEEQRLKWYTNKIPREVWVNKAYRDDDDVLIFSHTNYVLAMGTKLYPRQKGRKGFTLDKKAKKLKVWPGTLLKDLSIDLLLKDLRKEWVVSEGFVEGLNKGLVPWITPSLLRDILLDKITNPSDLCKKIISTLRLKGLSPEKLRKAIKGGNYFRHMLLECKDAVVDINDILDVKDYNSTMQDTIMQAKALGVKIDLKWSRKRLNEEHTAMTRLIMAEELNSIEDESIDLSEILPFVPPGYELLTSRKRVFEEGMMMSHCIYTNYWERIKNKRSY